MGYQEKMEHVGEGQLIKGETDPLGRSSLRPQRYSQIRLRRSWVSTRISWSPLSDLKGVKPPLEFGERIRDCSSGHAGKKALISPWQGRLVGFLELRRQCGVSHEVPRGSQGASCMAPGKSSIPFELQVRTGDCSPVTAGQNRPHLRLCPGPSVPLLGQQGSQGCILDSPGERNRGTCHGNRPCGYTRVSPAGCRSHAPHAAVPPSRTHKYVFLYSYHYLITLQK